MLFQCSKCAQVVFQQQRIEGQNEMNRLKQLSKHKGNRYSSPIDVQQRLYKLRGQKQQEEQFKEMLEGNTERKRLITSHYSVLLVMKFVKLGDLIWILSISNAVFSFTSVIYFDDKEFAVHTHIHDVIFFLSYLVLNCMLFFLTTYTLL